MGQRDGFSKGDITKINAMYNCPEKTSSVTKGDQSNASTPSKEGSNPFLAAAGSLLHLFIK